MTQAFDPDRLLSGEVKKPLKHSTFLKILLFQYSLLCFTVCVTGLDDPLHPFCSLFISEGVLSRRQGVHSHIPCREEGPLIKGPSNQSQGHC